MYFGTKNVANEVMILANDDFSTTTVTVALDEGAFLPEGTPISKTGTVVESGTAYGILLHRVDYHNPVAAVIIRGFLSEAALTKLGKNTSAYKAMLPAMVKTI